MWTREPPTSSACLCRIKRKKKNEKVLSRCNTDYSLLSRMHSPAGLSVLSNPVEAVCPRQLPGIKSGICVVVMHSCVTRCSSQIQDEMLRVSLALCWRELWTFCWHPESVLGEAKKFSWRHDWAWGLMLWNTLSLVRCEQHNSLVKHHCWFLFIPL